MKKVIKRKLFWTTLAILIMGINTAFFWVFFMPQSQVGPAFSFANMQIQSKSNFITGSELEHLPAIIADDLDSEYQKELDDSTPQIQEPANKSTDDEKDGPNGTGTKGDDSDADDSDDNKPNTNTEENDDPSLRLLNTVSLGFGTHEKIKIVTWQYNSNQVIVREIVDGDFSNEKSSGELLTVRDSYKPQVEWCKMAEQGFRVIDVAFYAEFAIEASCLDYTGGWLYGEGRPITLESTQAREEILKLCKQLPRRVCADAKGL